MTRTVRLLGTATAIVALGLAAAVIASWIILRSSLPVIDGAAVLPGLETTAVIDRDAAGVPTIAAGTRTDLARALGYVHAQDRYFEMDLMRRAAAGELSALLGPSQLAVDRQLRVHRFREVARSVVSGLGPLERAVLDAYAAGVNAGLASLRARPFEYWLLRSEPQPWTAEDSVLCVHAMYLQLQDSRGHRQLQRGLLRATLPDAAFQFLDAGAPEWDAAVDGTRSTEPRVPPASEFDLRGTPSPPPARSFGQHGVYPGSNNWAVAGSRTATGAGLLANDMHLNLRVPNIWYRARMILRPPGSALDITGVTLPGTPLAVAGSNGSVAWGFTNSNGEFLRVIRLMPVAADPGAYMTAGGPHPLQGAQEIIDVRGAPSERLRIVSTEWGPVVGEDWDGRPYALQWSAQNPGATNLNLMRLEQARSVDEALDAAATFGIPGQNFLVADRAGHIGWTLAGRLPVYPAGAGLPQVSTDAVVGSTGWLQPADQPRVEDPGSGLLWSANARVVGGAAASAIGDDGMDRGARASQIRDDLERQVRPMTPAMSLAIQLDDRAVFLERWRNLLGQLLERLRSAGDLGHDETRKTLDRWSGHAAPQDPAYRLVSVFRDEVATRAFAMLATPARRRAPNFAFEVPSSFEGPLWRLLQQQPLHLLTADYADWDAFLLAALKASEKLPDGCRSLTSCTWGSVNTVRIAHPLSGVLSGLARLIDMPPVVVAGGWDMPRVQGRHFGASERFSVAPGHESEGTFEMPGAQSGHPLSPFFRAGFEDWVRGTAAPFLPGPSTHRFTLMP